MNEKNLLNISFFGQFRIMVWTIQKNIRKMKRKFLKKVKEKRSVNKKSVCIRRE